MIKFPFVRNTPTENVIPILLIGSQKSGSSYLFRLIEQHPSIARAKLKEPKILSKPMYDGSNFISHFRVQPDHRFVLDGSVSYLHVPGTAQRAAAQLGADIPILVVLRDPLDRAVSGYLHEVKHGRELRAPEDVFDLPNDPAEAIAAEDAALQRAWKRGVLQPHNPPEERYRDPLFQFRYVANSWYRHQLDPWMAAFSDLRLIDFVALRADPASIAARVHRWLGLPEAGATETRLGSNPTRLRHWQALRENRALQHDHARPSLSTVWRQQRDLFCKLNASKPTLPAGLSTALRSEYDILKKQGDAKWL